MKKLISLMRSTASLFFNSVTLLWTLWTPNYPRIVLCLNFVGSRKYCGSCDDRATYDAGGHYAKFLQINNRNSGRKANIFLAILFWFILSAKSPVSIGLRRRDATYVQMLRSFARLKFAITRIFLTTSRLEATS